MGSITIYSAIWWYDLFATLSENENNKKKLSQFQFHILVVLLVWQILKRISSWTSKIIQFIRFENHMDRPRGLKYFLEYVIVHLSICSFTSHGCFTGRIRLKSGWFQAPLNIVKKILRCYKLQWMTKAAISQSIKKLEFLNPSVLILSDLQI